jgi:3-oxoacyl-[acyl-carrier protein] reductase
MRERAFGRIVVVLSSGVLQPIPKLVASNALRLAMAGWLKTLAAEVAADGITVNGLAPGRIHTERVDFLDERTASLTGRGIDDVRAASRALIPARRYGEVEEFGAVAAFLVSRQAAYVTGSIVRVDGGLIQAL